MGAKPEARRAYPDRPFVGLGVVVLRDDRVLLVRRGKAPRGEEWSIPGGAQELGETAADGALREVREETGIAVRLLGLVDVVDGIWRDRDGRVRYHYTLVDFAAAWVAGEAVAADDVAEARWVKLAEVASYPLWAETLRVIRQAAGMFGR